MSWMLEKVRDQHIKTLIVLFKSDPKGTFNFVYVLCDEYVPFLQGKNSEGIL